LRKKRQEEDALREQQEMDKKAEERRKQLEELKISVPSTDKVSEEVTIPPVSVETDQQELLPHQ